jgi:hypothetical protein
MATETRIRTSTTALILATFALVGVMTTGAIVPAAFAQTADPFTDDGGLLDRFLEGDNLTDSNTDGSGITDEAETATEETTQTEDQSEHNIQGNSIDQDQTGAINQETGSGSGSEVASAAQSDSESTYESKYKSKNGGSTYPIPGTSSSTSDSASDVSNTGGLDQDQTLSSPAQINTNNAGDDESRSAVVGFEFGFEQFSTQDSAVPGTGTSLPIIVP